MIDPLGASLAGLASALRARELTAAGLVAEALGRHRRHGEALGAYRHVDAPGAEARARQVDARLEAGKALPPLGGIPVSVKDLYGVAGFDTWAGSPRALPEPWTRDGWLVATLRARGAVFVGKTHTVEFGYGALGVNPHWGAPRNPWDPHRHRIPGGSSSGAGVSLVEGSARVALGSDTGGSIRIPASMTGTVGLRTTTGRWPTDGVVPLSETLDTVGALTRSVADAAYVFGAVDPRWGDPGTLLQRLSEGREGGRGPERVVRVGVPRCGVWNACAPDVGDALDDALSELVAAGWRRVAVDGGSVERAEEVYLHRALAGAEGRAFLEAELPEWLELLHPIVGERLRRAPAKSSELYSGALREQRRLQREAGALFEEADVLVLPTVTFTPPPVEELADLGRYWEANAAALRPTCSASVLGLPAITLPVGLDRAGMPVGLQLLAPGGADEALLAAALRAERILGPAHERIGPPVLVE